MQKKVLLRIRRAEARNNEYNHLPPAKRMYTYRKYRIPVHLAADQKAEIRRLTDGQRHAYNWAVSRARSGEPVTEYGLHAELTVMRRAHDWIRSLPVAVQRAGIRDALTARRLSARYGRGGLRYRTKRRAPNTSLKCPLAPRVEDSCTLRLPRFGAVRANIPNQVMEHEPRSYEFAPHGKSYLLYVTCRVKIPQWNIPVNPTVKGIDRGTVEPTVVATMPPDGTVTSSDSYDTVSPFRADRQWHQRMQSKASKMNRHSDRFRRLHARIRGRLQRAASRRAYAECVAAKHICTDHDPHTITLEDLKIGKMTRKGGRHKKGMNREMRFVRHHMIEQRIRNRAELAGIRIMTVDPRRTSQTCARCPHVDPKSRVTRDMFRCTKCHYVQQADVNAAVVIGRNGLPPSDHTGAGRGAGTALVRRELDARLNCFVGGPSRGCENQAPARSHVQGHAEKQRPKLRETWTDPPNPQQFPEK